MSERDTRQIPELRDYAAYQEALPRASRRLEQRLGASLERVPRRVNWMQRGLEAIMENWQMTLGLSAAVVLAAVVVPRLTPGGGPEPGPITGAALVEVTEGAAEGGQALPVVDTLTQEGPLAVTAALDRSVLPQGAGEESYLVVTFQAPEAAVDIDRQPVHVAVVVDTSGSMNGDQKIDFAREATWELARQLGPQDSFALVGFNSDATLYQPSTPVADPTDFYSTIASLSPGGNTFLSAGLHMGLQQLEQVEGEGVKRVVLLSDGISQESRDAVASLAASHVEDGITVSALGLGLDFDSRLLLAISDAGGGRYRYVDDPSTLAGDFADELRAMSSTTARGVSLQVELAEGVEVLEVFGYEDYDGGRTADGYRAFVGDMHAGEVRKVVARLRVPDEVAGRREVAQVSVDYTEVDSGARLSIGRRVEADVSAEAGAVSASVDPDVALLAAQACAGDALADGVLYWESGDADKARAAFHEGAEVLATLEARYALPEVSGFRQQIQERAASYQEVQRGTDAARRLDLETTSEALDACY
jgi:Ca-activated chloride channel family protein